MSLTNHYLDEMMSLMPGKHLITGEIEVQQQGLKPLPVYLSYGLGVEGTAIMWNKLVLRNQDS